MEGMGWIAAIIVGALAGWIAENLMKSEHGLLMNIILGILGAVLRTFIFINHLGGSQLGGHIRVVVRVDDVDGLASQGRMLGRHRQPPLG